MKQHKSVAVLGLGAMGHAFATNLLKNGFAVSGWNRTRSRGEDLQNAGMCLSLTPQEAVQSADVVILMLSDATITEQVLVQIIPTLKKGAVVAQMGTIGIEATEKLIANVNNRRPDVVFLDAPVSGTKTPAENAQIVVLASGERERAGAAEEVFTAIAKATKWLGKAGAASRMKLVVNAWLISMMQGLSESTKMAAEFGFSPEEFWLVLEDGPLAAQYAKAKLDMIAADSYEPQMQLIWALKDVNLALAAANDSQLPSLKLISSIWQDAVDQGYGNKDLSVVYRFLSEKSINGVRLD